MAKQEEHFETPDKRGTAIKQGAKENDHELNELNEFIRNYEQEDDYDG